MDGAAQIGLSAFEARHIIPDTVLQMGALDSASEAIAKEYDFEVGLHLRFLMNSLLQRNQNRSCFP